MFGRKVSMVETNRRISDLGRKPSNGRKPSDAQERKTSVARKTSARATDEREIESWKSE